MVPWTHASLPLDRFSRFCTANPRDQHTDTQTTPHQDVARIACDVGYRYLNLNYTKHFTYLLSAARVLRESGCTSLCGLTESSGEGGRTGAGECSVLV